MSIRKFENGEVSLRNRQETVVDKLNAELFGPDLYLSGDFYFAEKFNIKCFVSNSSNICLSGFWTPSAEQFLKDFGFVQEKIFEEDGNTSSVWLKFCPVSDRTVRISLMFNLKLFLNLQDKLSESTVWWINSLSSEDVAGFWRSLYDTHETFFKGEKK